MWFFVFSINCARTREGRPARRKLTELLVKSKKTLVAEPAAIFFVFQVNISCKTTSIILYFKYASFSVVTKKKRQNTNPHPDGNFFDDLFGLGILRDECCDCQATYIGETGRNLNTRLTERATRNGDLNNNIAEHHLQTNHRIDWDSAECVIYSTDYYQRLTLESWFTNLEQTPLNRCQQLPAPYKRLINDTKTDKQ